MDHSFCPVWFSLFKKRMVGLHTTKANETRKRFEKQMMKDYFE